MSTKDEWREQLALRLLGEEKKPLETSSNGATALEIAFGIARSEVTYVLEFARANGLPAAGSVIGDDVTLRFGDHALRFRIDRRDGFITSKVAGSDEERITYDEDKRALGLGGKPLDMQKHVRDAIDSIVKKWRATAPHAAAAALGPRGVPASRESATVRDMPAAKSERESGEKKE